MVNLEENSMKKLFKLFLTATMVLGLGACSNSNGGSEEQTSLTIQFVPTNSDSVDATTAAFAEYMKNLLDMDVEVTVATDYTTIVEAMESGQVDVGIMPPAAYVQARSLDAATSILSSTLVDYDENEMPVEGTSVGTFKAEVITRADADISSWKDLEGKNVAYLSVTSASGYVYPVAEMKEAGVDIDSVNFTAINDVVSAIKAVISGQVDACFTFEGSRYVFNNVVTDDAGNPVDLFETTKAAILSEGDIPNDAIAVLPSMSDELKEKVKEAFLTMASDEEGLEIMSAWGHTGYVESDEAAYDTTAEYIEAAGE